MTVALALWWTAVVLAVGGGLCEAWEERTHTGRQSLSRNHA